MHVLPPALAPLRYERWASAQGFKVSTVERTPGEEAGVKSVELTVEGRFAYGYLKGGFCCSLLACWLAGCVQPVLTPRTRCAGGVAECCVLPVFGSGARCGAGSTCLTWGRPEGADPLRSSSGPSVPTRPASAPRPSRRREGHAPPCAQQPVQCQGPAADELCRRGGDAAAWGGGGAGAGDT